MSGDILFLSSDEVARLLSAEECIDVMEEALAALARGEALVPLRQLTSLPEDRGLILTMPSYLASADAAAVKVLTVYRRNEGTPYESHQGVVVLFEAEHGRPVAIADASGVTAIRTAAVSGAATRALARRDARTLAILGTGLQAHAHLDAMRSVRTIDEVRVWGRTHEKAVAFALEERKRHAVAVEDVPTARDAVDGADIVCTVTSSAEPILEGEWLAPGAHVNAVGYSGAKGRELASSVMARARVIVDRRESALSESGDVLLAIADGAIDENHIAGELGDVIVGRIPGRTSEDEVTVFESLGLSIEDLAAVNHVYRKAGEAGAGVSLRLRDGVP